MQSTDEFIDRYVAMWNEPDPDQRRKVIDEMWADDGRHVLEPPEEMRTTARALGFPSQALELQGHDQLEDRVTRAHAEFVAPGQYRFRSRGNAARLGDVVKFNWEMVTTDGAEVAGVGLDIFVLDADDRISVHYQFVD